MTTEHNQGEAKGMGAMGEMGRMGCTTPSGLGERPMSTEENEGPRGGKDAKGGSVS